MSETITVNGRQVPFRKGLTLTELLREQAASGPGVAVEVNLVVVPRTDHEKTLLNPGDEVEIVRLVGGG